LFPIGGVANLERLPEKPIQELMIAVAGPLVNFFLALVLLPAVIIGISLQVRNGAGPQSLLDVLASTQTPGLVNLLVYLLLMNLMLGLFNLLPAFPMDGGRILRSLLAMSMDYVQATRAAVTVGRVVALLMAIWGIFLWSTGGGGIFLLLIAFFVYVGGGAEREAVESRAILRKYIARDALTPDAQNLYVTDRLKQAADQLMVSYQTDFPVFDLAGEFVGVLTRPALVKALQYEGPDARVVDAMTPASDLPVCSPSDDLASVWEQMGTSGRRVAAVHDGGRFLGLITLDDVTEVVNVMGAAVRGTPAGSRSRTESNMGEHTDDA
jgi:Zn-dependent protease